MKSQKIESQKITCTYFGGKSHKFALTEKTPVKRYYSLQVLCKFFKYLQVWLNGNIRLNKTTDVEENADYAQHLIFQGFH